MRADIASPSAGRPRPAGRPGARVNAISD